MGYSRRDFLKMTGATLASLSLVQLGVDVSEIYAYATKLKTEGAREFISICPFCAVCCQVIAYAKDGKLLAVEGDPDFPVNQGALCAKGASLLAMYGGEHRLVKPLYRAPHSDKWEEKDWEWTLDTIARRIKDTRDANFVQKNKDGKTVNRLEHIFMMGTSHASNEECALMHQALRSAGIIYMDHQART